jgi:hypothetical protein
MIVFDLPFLHEGNSYVLFEWLFSFPSLMDINYFIPGRYSSIMHRTVNASERW